MQLQFIVDKKYDIEMIGSMGMGKEAYQMLEEEYRLNRKYVEQSKGLYQKSWDLISDDFSKYIEKRTGYKWFYDRYYCIVSVIHPGISNWGRSEEIVRWWKENPFLQRRITAHELVISHYFEIYKHHYRDAGLSDNQVWALAEIAAFALTGLDPDAKKFWPWDHNGYYYNHNYPQLVDLQKKMKPVYIKCINFDNYIKKGIRLVKNIDIKP